ncbi:MAG: hypothetical protein HY286_10810 [Planctomycetes bacterium]|nr:hypothetical protein [Planctomycetota bacterium]
MFNFKNFSWSTPISTLILAGAAGWLAVSGTLPAMKSRDAAQKKNVELRRRKDAIAAGIIAYKSEALALRTDYQYNRRIYRTITRGGPEPGD